MTRLRRAIASVDSRGSEERRAQARSRRGVFGRLTGDGMGALTLVTGAEAIAAVLDRLDTQARAARGGGDGRTLDQLRCDLATEALLRNHLAAQQPAGASTERGCPDTDATGGGPSDGTSGAPAGDPTSSGPPGSTNGWVTAAHAREIISRPGSVWATLPVDVDTGQALSRPTKAYRPTRAMVEHVQAVDGVCRGPGCEVLAGRCDIDHEQPWPGGQTAVGNLFSKHRLHHNLKTDGIWTSHPVTESADGHSADGRLEWTTLTGRAYVTRPKDWRGGLDLRFEGAGRARRATENRRRAEPDGPGSLTPDGRRRPEPYGRRGPEPDDLPPF